MCSSRRRLTELSRAESMRLLGSVSLGRLVFTFRAMPAIRPVNHVLDNGDIVIRSHSGAAVVSAADAAGHIVVAYEADTIDPSSPISAGVSSLPAPRNWCSTRRTWPATRKYCTRG